MRSPSRKRLTETFNVSFESAGLIKRLVRMADNETVLPVIVETSCPDTWRYARSCYHDPFLSRMWRRSIVLHAIDRILGTHGVEALRHPRDGELDAPRWEYLNAGDPYATTLLYTRATDTLRIGCWGDIAERLPGGRE